jgi:hypothetical protein
MTPAKGSFASRSEHHSPPPLVVITGGIQPQILPSLAIITRMGIQRNILILGLLL